MKYLWKGLRSGEFESGVVDALTRDEAVFLLKEKNVIITDLFCDESTALVDKKTKTKTNISFFSRKHKISEKQLLLFTRKLSAMLSSGLPVVPALEMLRDQSENEGIKAILSTIVEEVNAGVSISKSFEKFPDTFDSVYLNLIKAGESSGSLEKFLDKICQSLEKKIKIMSSLRSALTYPIILLVVAIGVIIVMMTFVVPVFAEMYSNMGKALPLPTQIIMDISNFIRSPISLLFVILLFIFFILFKTRMSKSLILKRKVDEKLLKLPVFGDLIRNSSIARIATVLSNLVSAGVGLIEAIEIARLSIRNEFLKEALENMKRDVFSGSSLEIILKKDNRFPETFKAFISVGERTGKLNDMLASIAKYYEEEFDSSVDRLSQLLEPVMIVFLGATIGFILVAMYLPIFSMGSGIN
jgi:type IV pilus assembly protein PilC